LCHFDHILDEFGPDIFGVKGAGHLRAVIPGSPSEPCLGDACNLPRYFSILVVADVCRTTEKTGDGETEAAGLKAAVTGMLHYVGRKLLPQFAKCLGIDAMHQAAQAAAAVATHHIGNLVEDTAEKKSWFFSTTGATISSADVSKAVEEARNDVGGATVYEGTLVSLREADATLKRLVKDAVERRKAERARRKEMVGFLGTLF
jgi:hypothetical protein